VALDSLAEAEAAYAADAFPEDGQADDEEVESDRLP
jgi:hypothetical protein